jgi:two-component system NtrC family sensor kinase
MTEEKTSTDEPRRKRARAEKDFSGLTRRLLHFANIGVPRNLFLRILSKHLVEGTGCEAVEIRTTDGDLSYRWHAEAGPQGELHFEMNYFQPGGAGHDFLSAGGDAALAAIRAAVFGRRTDASSPFFTENGSFWTGDASHPVTLGTDGDRRELSLSGPYRSIAVVRFEIDRKDAGLLELLSEKAGYFGEDDIGFFETVAQAIGVTVADRRAQRDLRERVKELTCLYGICRAASQPDAAPENVQRRIADLIRRALQFPEAAEAKVSWGDMSYETPAFANVTESLAADVVVDDQKRGTIEVGYVEAKGDVEGFIFRPEEQHLLDVVARQVSGIVERRQAAEERARIEEQLRHADRLATIGQLAAGIAHEINEPLLTVMGYTELATSHAGLPEEVKSDLGKVSAAALHAREVVKKLLIFARQVRTQKTSVDMNEVIEEALSWLKSRFAEENIKCVLKLSPGLLPLEADPAQLHQVVVNLVVNAIQATPGGGTVTISSEGDDEYVYLAVEDTGCGMNDEVRNQIFMPFFTTKDVGHGTGLGLAVVHGIVEGHGGTIGVRSEVGRGSRFVVILPLRGEGEAGGGQVDAQG